MNYRQWKKKYKKIHGYNPPLEEDKRKQRKMVKKITKQVNELDLPKIAKGIINVFSDCFRLLGEAFINAAEVLKTE